ncbi:hypothetical protein F4553_005962 [Allocatelliglobosispora scoriae]|uniref:DUF4367 domain-containing protein n=1 Tax=Allocatelliglobosispora scoriae TaxID=643052 RepID=A0A841BYG7_9ACTN|nr:hypothetical protein [Allocatelliglobosispora scoriae]MBB5872528.1 hypothetical protein [Allocatelliglobosispora scoriae]
MDDLEKELRDLSSWLTTPDAPDVTAAVRNRLTAKPKPRRRWRYYLAAVVVALLVGLLPPGRAALADAVTSLLRFAGITVDTSSGPVPHSASPSPLPSQRSAALVEAEQKVRFPIRVPALLGQPEQVLIADPDASGTYRVVTLVYRGGALRLDAFDGSLDPMFTKQSGGQDITWTQVGGDFALWIGGPHDVAYVDRAGQVRIETARLAASTLIWQEAGVSYRLEGDLNQFQALEIAESLG